MSLSRRLGADATSTPRLATALAMMLLAGATAARAKPVSVTALAVVINGAPMERPPTDPEAAAVFAQVTKMLRRQGFHVVRSADESRLIGARAGGLKDLGRLEIDLALPSFVFNVALLPPHWARTRTGEARVRDARTKSVLWSCKVKIPLDTPPGVERSRRTAESLYVELAGLQPAPATAGAAGGPAPTLAAVLEVNDPGASPESFAEASRLLAQDPAFRDGEALVALAEDARTAADPELRPRLLHRAVDVSGRAIAPALGRALGRATTEAGDVIFGDLLAEALGLLGIAAGDALAPALRDASLFVLLGARARYPFRAELPWIRARIEQLAVEAVDRTPDFDTAEDALRMLPLDEMTAETRSLLRSALGARVPDEDEAEYAARIHRLLPASEGSTDVEDRDAALDRTFLREARELRDAADHVRLEAYRTYLRCTALAGASDRLARALRLEEPLERELARALAGARDRTAEAAAVRAVFGPRPGELARAAFGRALLASLGPKPKDAELLALHDKHPDVDEVTRAVRDGGLVRAVEAHTFPAAPGDAATAAAAALGSGTKRNDGLRRRDLSPAAFVSDTAKLEHAQERGYATLERSGSRVLVRDGRVYRVVIVDSAERYHHGIRTGDTRAEAVAALGDPARTRALFFGREVLTWTGLHGGKLELHAVLDHGHVSLLYEEDPEVARGVLASLR